MHLPFTLFNYHAGCSTNGGGARCTCMQPKGYILFSLGLPLTQQPWLGPSSSSSISTSF
uniref:Uncharacterized protein n=1 Tax=Rhizophora mucronata TaxID=61149 RepID=A0A2P2PWT1_RHIMU